MTTASYVGVFRAVEIKVRNVASFVGPEMQQHSTLFYVTPVGVRT